MQNPSRVTLDVHDVKRIGGMANGRDVDKTNPVNFNP